MFKDLQNDIFTDISDRWSDYVCNFENLFGMRCATALADLNADGMFEMVVGNFSGGLELLNWNIAVNQCVVENQGEGFSVFPNPAMGRVTIEGSGRLTITNVLGQMVVAKEIHGGETVELPRGVWFVKLGNSVGKIVME